MKVVRVRENIRELLDRRNIPHKSFARKITISRGHLSQILRGNKQPSPRVRAAMQEALGEDFDTLFEIVDRPAAEKAGVA